MAQNLGTRVVAPHHLAYFDVDDLADLATKKGFSTDGHKEALVAHLEWRVTYNDLTNAQLSHLLKKERKAYTGVKEVLLARLLGGMPQPMPPTIVGGGAPPVGLQWRTTPSTLPARVPESRSSATTSTTVVTRVPPAFPLPPDVCSTVIAGDILELLSKNALVELCRDVGRPYSGTKPQLVDRLEGRVTFNALTNETLQALCSAWGIARYGNKAQLVSRLLALSDDDGTSTAPAAHASSMETTSAAASSTGGVTPVGVLGHGPRPVEPTDILLALDARRAEGKKTTMLGIVCEIYLGEEIITPQHNAVVKAAVNKLLAAGSIVRWTGVKPGGHAQFRRPGDMGPIRRSAKVISSQQQLAGTVRMREGDGVDSATPAQNEDEDNDTLSFFKKAADSKASTRTYYETRITRLSQAPHLEQSHRACIATPPVYLGDVYHSSKVIASGAMYQHILRDAAAWSQQDYDRSPLKAYFMKRSDGAGYRLKVDFDCSVDHLIPVSFGGLDHPRNYAFMSRALNASYGDRELDEKFATMSAHVRRKVCLFARAARDAAAGAVSDWLRTLPMQPGTKAVQ